MCVDHDRSIESFWKHNFSDNHTPVNSVNDFLPIFPHFQAGFGAMQYRRSSHNSAEHLLSSMKFPQTMTVFLLLAKLLYVHQSIHYHCSIHDTRRTALQDSHYLYLHKHMYRICKTCYIISMFFFPTNAMYIIIVSPLV